MEKEIIVSMKSHKIIFTWLHPCLHHWQLLRSKNAISVMKQFWKIHPTWNNKEIHLIPTKVQMSYLVLHFRWPLHGKLQEKKGTKNDRLYFTMLYFVGICIQSAAYVWTRTMPMSLFSLSTNNSPKRHRLKSCGKEQRSVREYTGIYIFLKGSLSVAGAQKQKTNTSIAPSTLSQQWLTQPTSCSVSCTKYTSVAKSTSATNRSARAPLLSRVQSMVDDVWWRLSEIRSVPRVQRPQYH